MRGKAERPQRKSANSFRQKLQLIVVHKSTLWKCSPGDRETRQTYKKANKSERYQQKCRILHQNAECHMKTFSRYDKAVHVRITELSCTNSCNKLLLWETSGRRWLLWSDYSIPVVAGLLNSITLNLIKPSPLFKEWINQAALFFLVSESKIIKPECWQGIKCSLVQWQTWTECFLWLHSLSKHYKVKSMLTKPTPFFFIQQW